jgi:NAD-dependent dihydropyrimidine dehydrogenase PreA subunit
MAGYGMWRGTPREQIAWYPTVDATKCKGCRECYEFCSHRVYGWDEEVNTAKVIEPFQCVVGCSSCSHQCKSEAISFPPLSILEKAIKDI